MSSDEKFSQEEKDWILAHHREFGSDVMARKMEETFGRKISIFHLKRYRREHGLQSGLTGHYEKGNVPWTKGKRWDDYMSPEAQAHSRQSCYKPGNSPYDTLPIGSEIVRLGYRWRKISDTPHASMRGNWRQVHRILWEEANGPIPKGMQVIFLNGDRTDIRLNNLKLVSNRERGYYRPLVSNDPELAELGIEIARAKTKLYKPQSETRRHKNGEKRHRDHQG